MKAALPAIVLLVVGGASAAGATLHTDAFDAGAQGWVSGAAVVYKATGGSGGGGFIQVNSFSHLATYNNDERWTGSFTSINTAQVKVDLMAPAPTPEQPSAPLEMRIVLFGSGDPRSADRWTSAVSKSVPNDGVWRSYVFPLGPTDIVSPGDPTNVYADLMGGVGRLMLRHDAATPDHSLDDSTDSVTGALGIDNIELAIAAQPPKQGDFTGDGLVNRADLTDPVKGFFARYGTDLDGNAFLAWQRDLDPTMTTVAAGSVPEPGTCCLLLTAAALVIRRPRTLSAMQ